MYAEDSKQHLMGIMSFCRKSCLIEILQWKIKSRNFIQENLLLILHLLDLGSKAVHDEILS